MTVGGGRRCDHMTVGRKCGYMTVGGEGGVVTWQWVGLTSAMVVAMATAATTRRLLSMRPLRTDWHPWVGRRAMLLQPSLPPPPPQPTAWRALFNPEIEPHMVLFSIKQHERGKADVEPVLSLRPGIRLAFCTQPAGPSMPQQLNYGDEELVLSHAMIGRGGYSPFVGHCPRL